MPILVCFKILCTKISSIILNDYWKPTTSKLIQQYLLQTMITLPSLYKLLYDKALLNVRCAIGIVLDIWGWYNESVWLPKTYMLCIKTKFAYIYVMYGTKTEHVHYSTCALCLEYGKTGWIVIVRSMLKLLWQRWFSMIL